MHIHLLSLSVVGLAHYMTSWKECTSFLLFKFFKLKKIKLIIEKYFLEFFFPENFNKSWRKCLNWINLKLRGLKWIKAKLENWVEIWINLKGQLCVLSLNLLWGTPYVWEESKPCHYSFEIPNNFPVLSTSLNSLMKFDYSAPIVNDHIIIKNFVL